MKSLTIVAIIATLGTFSASANETITTEELQVHIDTASTSVDYSTGTETVQEVILGAGSCEVTETSGIKSAKFSILKCEKKVNVQYATVDPRGFLNQETYIIEGSEEDAGVVKSSVTRTTGTDFSGLIGEETDFLQDFTSTTNLQSACNQVAASMNDIRYTDDEKDIIAECFEL